MSDEEPRTPQAIADAFLGALKAEGQIADFRVTRVDTARLEIEFEAVPIRPEIAISFAAGSYEPTIDELTALAEDKPTHFWVLSFVDPARPEGQRHLGTTIVAAESHDEALRKTWRLGINPGGEVMGQAVADDDTIDQALLAFMLNTLRSREEMAAAGVI